MRSIRLLTALSILFAAAFLVYRAGYWVWNLGPTPSYDFSYLLPFKEEEVQSFQLANWKTSKRYSEAPHGGDFVVPTNKKYLRIRMDVTNVVDKYSQRRDAMDKAFKEGGLDAVTRLEQSWKDAGDPFVRGYLLVLIDEGAETGFEVWEGEREENAPCPDCLGMQVVEQYPGHYDSDVLKSKQIVFEGKIPKPGVYEYSITDITSESTSVFHSRGRIEVLGSANETNR